MYNLNGIELDLDGKMLEEYSRYTVAKVGSEHFNNTLIHYAKSELHTDSFERAVYLYGAEVVAKKITAAIKDEMDTFTIIYEEKE